jgi:hypothetical protein
MAGGAGGNAAQLRSGLERLGAQQRLGLRLLGHYHGLLTSALGTPAAPEIFAFAGGAVAAFGLVELVVSGGYRRDLEDEPPNVKDIGSSVSVLSVGLAMACAYAVGALLDGLAAWPVGSFAATSAYLFLFGVELGLIERLARRRGEGPKG